MNFQDYDFCRAALAIYGQIITREEWDAHQLASVVVGMSGGVDSAVTALLLRLQGYKTIGLFMKNWDDENDPECSAAADWKDVLDIGQKLDFPVYSVNFSQDYFEKVFKEFLDVYQKGGTPNPDVLCNREIKFKSFYDYALTLGADKVATGHYAHTQGGVLLKARDQQKDQTYFLHQVAGEVLKNVLFPLGTFEKSQVRQIARDFNLSVAKKKDSTGICFIGERKFKTFLSGYLKGLKGNFIDLSGKVLGPHDGLCFYTIGQRKGLALGGPGRPWFVVGKDLTTKDVIVTQGEDHPALYSENLLAQDAFWIGGTLPNVSKGGLTAKIRYRQEEVPCTLESQEEELRVTFSTPVRAITPDQYVVFYQGDVCLGGARITEVANQLELVQKVRLPELGVVQVNL